MLIKTDTKCSTTMLPRTIFGVTSSLRGMTFEFSSNSSSHDEWIAWNWRSCRLPHSLILPQHQCVVNLALGPSMARVTRTFHSYPCFGVVLGHHFTLTVRKPWLEQEQGQKIPDYISTISPPASVGYVYWSQHSFLLSLGVVSEAFDTNCLEFHRTEMSSPSKG